MYISQELIMYVGAVVAIFGPTIISWWIER
jgi:hypothetical protein